MELEAAIEYKGGSACFRIHHEGKGIYTAYLLSYDGESARNTPEKITLVKGIRNWAGSVEDDVLLSELGGFIDKYWEQNENIQYTI
jgi:hypothetical protein